MISTTDPIRSVDKNSPYLGLPTKLRVSENNNFVQEGLNLIRKTMKPPQSTLLSRRKIQAKQKYHFGGHSSLCSIYREELKS
jgi:hypothetical protein